MNAEIELKSCPFCGAGDGFVGMSYVVGCSNCGAEGPKGDTDDETIALWNTRPAPTEAEAVDGPEFGPDESDVESAAIRLAGEFCHLKLEADAQILWLNLPESSKDRFRRMARAALGVGDG